jgi:hypothetical protein
MPYSHCKVVLGIKLITSTKINYLGGWVCDGK